jgi:Tfp pilus assembly protein PilN
VIWWIGIGIVVVSLLILVASAVPLLRRLGDLGVAARRLRLRVAEAQRMVPALAALQERAEQMQHDVAAIQERAAHRPDAHVSRRDG